MIYSQDFLFIQIEGGASMHIAHVDEPAETPLAPARDSVEINPAQIAKFMGPTWVLSVPDGPHEFGYQGQLEILAG